jgi:hypothetical protein
MLGSSLREQKAFGGAGYVLIVIFAAFTAFAASISVGNDNAGQGTSVSSGYTVTDLQYGNNINVNSNNSNTVITNVTFKLYKDGSNSSVPVSSTDTTIYVRLLPSGNWTQCNVTASPTVTCVLAGNQIVSYGAITGINIVAYDKGSNEEIEIQGLSTSNGYATGGDSVYNIYVGDDVYRVHEFQTVGTSTFVVENEPLNVEYLVVAGGGAGGGGSGSVWAAGGGGAGGLLTNVGSSTISIPTGNTNITVGAGGAATTIGRGNAGANSSIGSTVVATGGGGGGGAVPNGVGGNGGSGGGGTNYSTNYAGGTGIVGQGHDGATAGGGGGSGSSAINTRGGNGTLSTITGQSIYYSGGGGANHSSGGDGGGGLGATVSTPATAGVDGLGGGGGGGRDNPGTNTSGKGGNGKVVIRYKIVDVFSPLDLSPALWLDAADATTIEQTSGAVTQWTDKSGSQKHVIQGQSATRPTTGVTQQNGLNTISFDGVDDILESTSTIDLTGGGTVYVVAANNVRKDYNGLFRVANSATTESSLFELYWQQGAFNSGNLAATTNRGGTFKFMINSNVGPAVEAYYVAGAILPSTTATGRLFIQNTQISSTTGPIVPATSGNFWVGTGYRNAFLQGKIAEVVVIPRAISDAERVQLESYLSQKWGISS